MANNTNVNSTILSEHRRVVGTRYILATLNFVAILLGMIVTLFFVSRRGIYDAVLTVIWALIIINAVQIVLCLGEYILRSGFGINVKALPAISYIVGIIWVAALVLEMVLATIEAGTLRTDLLIVAIIQAVVAIVAYILWPNLDRRAIDSMIKPSSRGDEKKRAKKAKRYVAAYGFLTVVIVLAQAATLILYKMPPTFYDLFADNRALAYELNEDKDGYIVSKVYNGTSPYVNVPATFNNLPVVGIKAGALVDDGIIENYKITSITFGTPEKDENGNDVMRSNIQFINAGAINCSRLETLSIPESVTAIEDGAIRGGALRTVEYSASANFKYSIFSGCNSLARVLMSGERVGVIASLEGMPDRVNIQIDKDIYNAYRESNLNYVSSFSPILADDEFCIDFFTGCDYYIDSIFAKKGETVKLSYASLKKEGANGTPLSVDTLAYIKDAHELGTDGAKTDAAFRGWYYDGNYVEPVAFTESGEVSVTESTKIYAKWINEYNATLNWGSHKPDGQVDKVYWTEDDIRSFPVVSDRAGYSAGVVWTKAGTTEQVATSAGITESIALNATWQFDAPTISISSIGTNVEDGAINLTGATFVYDELKAITLSAIRSHTLESATGIPQDKKVVGFGYEWYHNGVKIDYNAANLPLSNVPESGTYTLRVIAQSPYNSEERSYAEVSYNVQITKKPLDLGSVVFNNLSDLTYNGLSQSVNYSGSLPVHTTNVHSTFTYTKDGYTSNDGVKDAGNYTVTLEFKKSDPNEAQNYATATLTTSLKVNPLVLTVDEWTQDTFEYAKTERSITIKFSNVVPGDDLGITYVNNKATDAGNYLAEVTGISNQNYNLLGTPTKDWTINPRPVTVQSWKLNGAENSVVTYTGAQHSIEAVVSGVMNGDDVSFSYDNEGSTMSATNVGKYTSKVTGITNKNYTLDSTATFKWEIVPAKLTVAFANSTTLTYNGREQSIYAIISGIVEDDVKAFKASDFNTEGTTATVKIDNGDDANSVKLLFGATNVGAEDYVAKINGLLSGGQHLANYVIEATEAKTNTFNITPKTIQIRRGDEKYIYNGKEQNMLLHVDGVLDKDVANIQFTIGEGGAKVPNTDSGVFIFYKGVNAGEYPTSITAVNDTNYKLLKEYNTPITMDKKTVTIKEWTMLDVAQSKNIAWSENSEFTYNKAGYKVGYTLDGAVEGENVTLTLTDAEQINALDDYYTTRASLDEANDVNVNYTFESKTIKWKINPKAITLTWTIDGGDAKTFVYSKETHTASYAISGAYEGDEILLNYTDEGATSASTVGNYKIIVASISNTNYKISDGASFEWSITPKEITIGWKLDGLEVTDLMYDAKTHAVTPVFNGLIGDDETSVNYDGAYNKISASNAGTYEVVINALTNPNYTIKGETAEMSWTIKPLPVQISWDGGDEFIYNQSYQRPSAVIDNKFDGDTIVVEYTGDGKNVGSYTVKISKIGNSNYTLTGATGNEKTYSIVAKVVVPQWVSNSFVYDSKSKTQSATYLSGAASADDGKVYNGDTLAFTYEGNKQTNAGDAYKAVLTGTGNKNYVLVDDIEKTEYSWSIAKCPVTLSWSYTSTTYNSNIQYPTATVSNNKGQTVSVTSYSGLGITAENKGSYSVTASGLDNANFTLDGGSGLTHSYEIKPLELEYEWYGVRSDNVNIVRDINNLVYDGYQTTVLVRFTNVCAGDDIVPVYARNVFLNADLNGKTVTVTLDGADKDNYSFIGLSKTVKVSPQPVKITWAGECDVIYDGMEHEIVPTVTGSVAGNNSAAVPFTVRINNYDGSINVDAGTYTYVVSLNDTNFTIANCEGAYLKELRIAPQEITVNWSNLEHVYDGTQKNAVATSNKAGVEIELLGYSKTTAGSQTVTAKSKDPNYTVTNNTATLKIEKAKISVEWIDINDVFYDGNTHKPTISMENVSGTNVKPDYTIYYNNDQYANPKNANTYALRLVLKDTNNYELTDPTVTEKSFVIKKKIVEIVGWTQSSFVYDGTTKYLYATLDDAAAQETLIYKSNSLKDAGTTTTTVTVGSNYEFKSGTVATKNLVITPATVTVSWWDANVYTLTYDKASHYIRATLSADSGVSVPFGYTYNGSSASSATTAGTYNVRVVLSDTKNFKLSDSAVTEKTLTINKKVLTVTWPTTTTYTYYYGTTRNFAATIGGTMSSDSVSFTYSGTTSASAAGNYTVKVSGLSGSASANYELPTSGIEKTFTINPQRVKITWSGLSYTYDGNAHAPTLTVKGYDDSRSVSYNMSDSYNSLSSHKDAGTYYYNIISLDDSNYTITGCQGSTGETMTIAPKVVTIEWPAQREVTYTGNPQRLVPTVKGISGVVLSPVTISGDYGRNVGYYEYEVTDIDDDNYTLVGATNTKATLTIVPRIVTITWKNMSQTYGTMNDGIEFAKLENVVYGDDVDVNILGFYTTLVAGEHTLTANTLVGDKADNYQLADYANTTATLVVNKQKAIVEWTDTTVEYDGKAHAPTLTITSMNGEDLSGYVRDFASYELHVDAGSYSYSASDFFSGSKNYELVDAQCTLYIQQKQIRLSDITVSYDKTKQGFSVTFNGVVEGDEDGVTIADDKLIVTADIIGRVANGSIDFAGNFEIQFDRNDVEVGDNYELVIDKTPSEVYHLSESELA